MTTLDPILRSVLFGIAGVVAGRFLCGWIVRLTETERDASPAALGNLGPAARWHLIPVVGPLVSGGRAVYRGKPVGIWWPLVELGTGLLFAAFAYAYLSLHCQEIKPEVAPDEGWRICRVFYHLVLISLLIVATGTDFRDYTISDWITIPGMIFAVVAATLSGQLQMVHIWVDYNDPMLKLSGPYLPEWMKDHQHLHGLAWSLCGLAVGGGMTLIVRNLSKWILGHEAMGFGDVTLMAMIGSFIGWQPVLFVFLLAPLCGLVISLSIHLFTVRTFLPYGPYLSAAAVIVLFTWRWIWTLELPISADQSFSVRRLMGDWQSLAWLGGISLGGLAILLGLVRIYRALPVSSRRGP